MPNTRLLSNKKSLLIEFGVFIVGVIIGYMYSFKFIKELFIENIDSIFHQVLIGFCVIGFIYVFIRYIFRSTKEQLDTGMVYKKTFILFFFTLSYILTSNYLHSQFSFFPSLDSPGSIMSVIAAALIIEFRLPYFLLAQFVFISFILTAIFMIDNNPVGADGAAIFGFNLVIILIIQLLVTVRRQF